MKSVLSLFLFGIASIMASCSGTSTDNPKEVATTFINALKEQNITVVKETATERIAKNVSLSFAKATTASIKELSSFETTYESDKKVGNIYFERFLYGEEKKDTMILKLIKVADKWKVAGVTQRPFRN